MKILLATDGTKYGDAAIEMLSRFRLAADDMVHVISVVDMAVPLAIDGYGGYLPDTAELEKRAREIAASIVEEATGKLRQVFENVSFSSDILFGSPESRIVETAETMEIGLIVIGSHGYRRWERLLLGSVSNSVVHHAPCSVLVVRTAHE